MFDKDESGTIDKAEMAEFIKMFTQPGDQKQDVVEVLMITSTPSKHRDPPRVNPEELISHIFARIMPDVVKLQVTSCNESLIDNAHDAFDGQYPVLVYKHWFIPRRYIWQFWCKLSEIDDDLPQAALDQTKILSELILNRLSVLSRSNEIKQN